MKTAETMAPERSPSSPLASRPPRRRVLVATTWIVIAGLISGGVVFAWQRVAAGDQERSLARVVEQRDAARAALTAQSGRIDDLEARLATARARVEAADAEVVSMLGPMLPDGKHLGKLYAVGASQQPPRLVIDIEQWFTDQAAVDAAIEDGNTIDPGINGYHIRNESPRWRTIEVDPTAEVSLVTYPYADPEHPRIVSLTRFEELFSSYDGRLLMYSPFWITVDDGKVTAIAEQFIP
jgi:hypothetical protein